MFYIVSLLSLKNEISSFARELLNLLIIYDLEKLQIEHLITERLILIPFTKEMCENILNHNYCEFGYIKYKERNKTYGPIQFSGKHLRNSGIIYL